MTRQPLRRQIRTLVVCASFAALVATVSLGLIRLNGGQLTNQAGRRIESLSLLVLLAGLSGAASLAAAGRILLRRYDIDTDALRRLQKHTLRRQKHLTEKANRNEVRATAGKRDLLFDAALNAACTLREGLRQSALIVPVGSPLSRLDAAAAEFDLLVARLRELPNPEHQTQEHQTQEHQTHEDQTQKALHKLAAAVSTAVPVTTSHTDLAII